MQSFTGGRMLIQHFQKLQSNHESQLSLRLLILSSHVPVLEFLNISPQEIYHTLLLKKKAVVVVTICLPALCSQIS